MTHLNLAAFDFRYSSLTEMMKILVTVPEPLIKIILSYSEVQQEMASVLVYADSDFDDIHFTFLSPTICQPLPFITFYPEWTADDYPMPPLGVMWLEISGELWMVFERSKDLHAIVFTKMGEWSAPYVCEDITIETKDNDVLLDDFQVKSVLTDLIVLTTTTQGNLFYLLFDTLTREWSESCYIPFVDVHPKWFMTSYNEYIYLSVLSNTSHLTIYELKLIDHHLSEIFTVILCKKRFTVFYPYDFYVTMDPIRERLIFDLGCNQNYIENRQRVLFYLKTRVLETTNFSQSTTKDVQSNFVNQKFFIVGECKITESVCFWQEEEIGAKPSNHRNLYLGRQIWFQPLLLPKKLAEMDDLKRRIT